MSENSLTFANCNNYIAFEGKVIIDTDCMLRFGSIGGTSFRKGSLLEERHRFAGGG